MSKTEAEDFERAFVATSYALARRGEELTAPLSAPGTVARQLAAALGHADRQVRAVVLAREMARLVKALERGRLA
jgi:hypothetical protein